VEVGLQVTDRPQRLLRGLEDPHTDSAGLLVLVGNESKKAAFRRFAFQPEQIRGETHGEIHLLASSFRESRHKRIFVANTDVSHPLSNTAPVNKRSCHEVYSYASSEQCLPPEPYSVSMILHRTLFPCADVICVFVDDLGGFQSSLAYLNSWLTMGPPSRNSVRPQVLLIVRHEEKIRHQHELGKFLQGRRKRQADLCFNGLIVTGVPRISSKRKRRKGTQTRRWQVLNFVIAKALESVRQSRRRSDTLFTPYHLSYFLQYGARTALVERQEPFDFIKVSRHNRCVASDLSDHLLNFLRGFQSLTSIHRVAIPLIASSLLLDHYAPGMHCKKLTLTTIQA
jgi:hypothetical protein